MLNLQVPFEHIEDPFSIYIAHNLLAKDQLRRLYDHAPVGMKRFVRAEEHHEKRYAMNVLYLMENSRQTQVEELSSDWTALLADLRSEAFLDWIEHGTGMRLRDLATDIGVYTQDEGDFISVHKDKPNKAITAVLYLNPDWPATGGGAYEVRRSGDPKDEPVRVIPPRGGQFLAFPPTGNSWHAVSAVTTQGKMPRLTVQVEFWKQRKDEVYIPVDS